MEAQRGGLLHTNMTYIQEEEGGDCESTVTRIWLSSSYQEEEEKKKRRERRPTANPSKSVKTLLH